MGHGDHAGPAKRRERRLRHFLRHEQLTGLSEKKHHSSRGQRMDRTGEGGNEMQYTAKFRRTPFTPSSLPSLQRELFQLFEEEPGEGRPGAVEDPRRRGWWTSSWRSSGFWTSRCPDVPKISQDRIPQVDRDPQRVEQLVEMPTVVSPSFVLQLAEQNVDIPVPGARGFLDHGGLHCFHPEQSSLQSSVEQNVDNLVPCGGLQNFLSGQSSTASSSVLPEEPFQGFFSHFSRAQKSAKVASQASADLGAHSSPSTTSAYGRTTLVDDDDGVEGFFEDDAGNVWIRISKNWWTIWVSLGCTFVVVARCRSRAFPAAPAVGTPRGAVAVGARGQVLGIPWPLLGCPCRLFGRLKMLEYGQFWDMAVCGCCRLRRLWKSSTHFLREAGLWNLF